MNTLVLVDSYNLINRFVHGMPMLTNSSGRQTHGTTGFIRYLWKIEDEFQGAEVVPVFDIENCAKWRKNIYPGYKSSRGQKDQELIDQIEDSWEICSNMYPSLKPGNEYEADDVIYTMAMEALEYGVGQVVIVSADKDFFQMVSDRIKVARPGGGTFDIFCAEKVEKKMGVAPNLIVPLLALMGDDADDIPGIDGCGPKTAAKWLNEHKDIERLLSSKDSLKPAKPASLLNEEFLKRNVNLVTLQRLDSLPFPSVPDPEKAIAKMRQLQMNSTCLAYKVRSGLIPDIT